MRRFLMALAVLCLSTASFAQTPGANPPKDLVGNWSGPVRNGGMSPERPPSGTMGAVFLEVSQDGSIVLWQNLVGSNVMNNPPRRAGESGYEKLTPLPGTKADFTEDSIHFIVHWDWKSANGIREEHYDWDWLLAKGPGGVTLSARQHQTDANGTRNRNVSGPMKKL
jgi:hypothetical protein